MQFFFLDNCNRSLQKTVMDSFFAFIRMIWDSITGIEKLRKVLSFACNVTYHNEHNHEVSSVPAFHSPQIGNGERYSRNVFFNRIQNVLGWSYVHGDPQDTEFTQAFQEDHLRNNELTNPMDEESEVKCRMETSRLFSATHLNGEGLLDERTTLLHLTDSRPMQFLLTFSRISDSLETGEWRELQVAGILARISGLQYHWELQCHQIQQEFGNFSSTSDQSLIQSIHLSLPIDYDFNTITLNINEEARRVLSLDAYFPKILRNHVR